MAIAHQLVSQALNTLCEQVRGGSFAVTNSDGATTRYGSDEPLFAVRFNDENVISLGHDDLLTSVGEAYMDGRVAWKATSPSWCRSRCGAG